MLLFKLSVSLLAPILVGSTSIVVAGESSSASRAQPQSETSSSVTRLSLNISKGWNPLGWLFGGSSDEDAPVDRRRGGASRDQCPPYGNRSDYTAIMPSDDLDLSKRYTQTASGQPSFWFYVPFEPGNPEEIEFTLIDENEDTVYEQRFVVSDTPGIVQIHVSDEQFTLVEDKLYRWVFSAICDPDNRSGDITINGWIKRVPLDESLEELQGTVPSMQSFEAFSNEKLWHESLTILMTLKTNQPENTAIQDLWNEILVDIRLDDLADAPISSCCQPES